jgi:TnpA family transposase
MSAIAMDFDDNVWFLSNEELSFVYTRNKRYRLGFAALMKFFQYMGRFPESLLDIPKQGLQHLTKQLNMTFSPDDYQPTSPLLNQQKSAIRKFCGFRSPRDSDLDALREHLFAEVIKQCDAGYLTQCSHDWYHSHHIEQPRPKRIKRLVNTVLHTYNQNIIQRISTSLSDNSRSALDALLVPGDDNTISVLQTIKMDAGRPSLETALREISKLDYINSLSLPKNIFADIEGKLLQSYRRRVSTESIAELRQHPNDIRYAYLATFCHIRRAEIIDNLGDLIIRLVHKVGTRAKKRVDTELIGNETAVHGKHRILYKIINAMLKQPDGIIRDVLFSVVDEETLTALLKEYQTKGPTYVREIQTLIQQSWNSHYRRMLLPILSALTFQSNNNHHRPVIDALDVLKSLSESKQRFIPIDDIPVNQIIPSDLKPLVIDTNSQGKQRVHRMHYELCVLQALREGLRCKEIWIEGANRYRNPDDDVPQDFADKRENYYALLGATMDADEFIARIKEEMTEGLNHLRDTLPGNDKLNITPHRKHKLCLSPLTPQKEPHELRHLKKEIGKCWPMTSLLDVLNETELRTGFSKHFKGIGNREILDREEIRHRALLCLYGLGTNMGLKPVLSKDEPTTYDELRHIKQRYLHNDALRAAIADISNAIFDIRQKDIWGEATIACASDSKKFGAWDQNLLTEWHLRYFGRGIMIYWHVEKNANCIYSQLTRCSASEAANMIKGVLNHCTTMSVNRQYVDTHGQSEVAFAFCRLFGFELMPRLKDIADQKLSLVNTEDRQHYNALDPILRTQSINWDIIHQNYDEMVKYAVAMKTGTAEPEAILRRFTKDNTPQHPTYKALSELGKAIKTIFLCRYLSSEETRREIQEGLNVVENWNSANSFIFYGKNSEISTNELDDQEISVLCLHLLQISLVYINTIMIQEILKNEKWKQRLQERDRAALTPLIYFHINPYGNIRLNRNHRLNLAL